MSTFVNLLYILSMYEYIVHASAIPYSNIAQFGRKGLSPSTTSCFTLLEVHVEFSARHWFVSKCCIHSLISNIFYTKIMRKIFNIENLVNSFYKQN